MISEHTVDVAGTPVRWLEQGTGLPVALVHGIPTSPALWRHVLPRLTGMRVLAFEMTGYGESIPAGRDRDISVSAQADRLNAWLAELGIERAVLVGHDLGGGVVHISAVREPQRCAGLLITNGIGYDSWPIPSVKLMRAAAPLLATLPAAALKPALGVLLARGHGTRAQAREALGVHGRPYAQSMAAGRRWPGRSPPWTSATPLRCRTPCRALACRRASCGGSPTRSRRSSTASASPATSGRRCSASKAAGTSPRRTILTWSLPLCRTWSPRCVLARELRPPDSKLTRPGRAPLVRTAAGHTATRAAGALRASSQEGREFSCLPRSNVNRRLGAPSPAATLG